jgi:hypothetical protein
MERSLGVGSARASASADLEHCQKVHTISENALKGKTGTDSRRNFHFLASPSFGIGRLSRCRIKLLGVLQGVPRELVSLLAEFVSCSMICFAMGYSCDGMGVGCQIVKFCGLIVRTLRHGLLLACSMQTVRPGIDI